MRREEGSQSTAVSIGKGKTEEREVDCASREDSLDEGSNERPPPSHRVASKSRRGRRTDDPLEDESTRKGNYLGDDEGVWRDGTRAGGEVGDVLKREKEENESSQRLEARTRSFLQKVEGTFSISKADSISAMVLSCEKSGGREKQSQLRVASQRLAGVRFRFTSNLLLATLSTT